MPSASYCARCRGRCRERAFTPDRYEDDGRGGIRMIRNPHAGRFLTHAQMGELYNLWHLSRTALSGQRASRYDRMLWASKEFGKAHPSIGSTAAYKDLDVALKRFHGNPRRRTNPRRRRPHGGVWALNPGGPNVNLLIGVGAIAVGAWLLFRTPTGGGPSLWQSMTGPSYPNPGVLTVPGTGGTTIGPSILGTVGTTIAEWISGLATAA